MTESGPDGPDEGDQIGIRGPVLLCSPSPTAPTAGVVAGSTRQIVGLQASRIVAEWFVAIELRSEVAHEADRAAEHRRIMHADIRGAPPAIEAPRTSHEVRAATRKCVAIQSGTSRPSQVIVCIPAPPARSRTRCRPSAGVDLRHHDDGRPDGPAVDEALERGVERDLVVDGGRPAGPPVQRLDDRIGRGGGRVVPLGRYTRIWPVSPLAAPVTAV